MNIKEIIIRIKKIKVNAIEHIDIEPGLRWIFLFKKIFIFAKKKSWARRKRKREKLSPHQASDGSVVGSKISWFMFIGILCIFFIYTHLRFKLLARKKMEKSFSYSLLSFDFQSVEKNKFWLLFMMIFFRPWLEFLTNKKKSFVIFHHPHKFTFGYDFFIYMKA